MRGVHVMLDLETWGTRPGSALRSIGAVSFTLGSDISGGFFYRNIDRRSCEDVGLSFEPATVEWWSKQAPEAQEALLIDPQPLSAVVDEFQSWWRAHGAQWVWCQGGNFDEPLWSDACRACGRSAPWKYWNARCTRTIYHLAGFDPRTLAREGTHHNALDDALFQVRCVQESYRRLTSPTGAAA
jgi:hypothetical protein